MAQPIEFRDGCIVEMHQNHGACYMCCDDCNHDRHICHFCGERLYHDSYEDDAKENRHYLSDCRPDLIDGSYFRERGLPVELHTDGPMV